MTPEEMTYLAVLLFSIPVGFAFNGRGPRTRQWGGAALGAGLTLVTCGPHALHSLVTSLVTWALVRLLPRRCGGAALAWTFGYLLFFRTLWVWGWPQPPPYANALQLLLTLKMVSLASDVQERWEAEPAGVTSSERDELIGSVPPRPGLGETLCYSYCYLGLLTGPFYRMGTHRDWVLGSAPPGSWRLVLRRLRWVPVWGLTGELAGRLFPGGLRDPRLWGWGFPRRLFAMGPAFLALRARFYVGWGCAEGACLAAGFGGNPPESHPRPGWGATRPCPRHKGPPPRPELWDFAAIRTCSPRDTERARGVGAGLRGWNRTVQWWLVRYVHARARGRGPALRNAWTMLVSAFWHGLHPGIYLSFLSVPLWLAAEGALGRLLGGVPKIRGVLWRIPPGIYTMRVFEYLSVGFILQDFEATLNYWGSIYFCLHLLPLFILGLDAVLKPGRGGGHPKTQGEGPKFKGEGPEIQGEGGNTPKFKGGTQKFKGSAPKFKGRPK
ncbi:lysophospholipid acyltransferase 7 [Caloenas nicobarica]|uniref:lysophospholipid acyltransferase 7 n=1 Tax=Caloenas nicobarica TaxID=187106 RepID=UPI0032B79F16